MDRRSYAVSLILNGREIEKVIIDPHYEERHSDSVTDEIILNLVKKYLDGEEFESISGPDEDGFEYFVRDSLELDGKRVKADPVLLQEQIC